MTEEQENGQLPPFCSLLGLPIDGEEMNWTEFRRLLDGLVKISFISGVGTCDYMVFLLLDHVQLTQVTLASDGGSGGIIKPSRLIQCGFFVVRPGDSQDSTTLKGAVIFHLCACLF